MHNRQLRLNVEDSSLPERIEVNILCLVNKCAQTTEAIGGIVTFFKE